MTGTHEEWLAARLPLLEAEKELTRPATSWRGGLLVDAVNRLGQTCVIVAHGARTQLAFSRRSDHLDKPQVDPLFGPALLLVPRTPDESVLDLRHFASDHAARQIDFESQDLAGGEGKPVACYLGTDWSRTEGVPGESKDRDENYC